MLAGRAAPPRDLTRLQGSPQMKQANTKPCTWDGGVPVVRKQLSWKSLAVTWWVREEVSVAQTWRGGGQPPPGWCQTTATRSGERIPHLHLAPATAHLGLGIQFGLPGTEKAQKVSSARGLGAGAHGKIHKEKLVLLREFFMPSPDTQ